MAMDVVSYIARVLASGGGEGEVCVAAATRDEALTDGEAYEDATGGAEASAVETGIVRREMSASNGGGGLVLGDTTLAKVVRALAACGVKMRGRGNFTYNITEVGAKYVERLDGAARAPKPL